MLSAACHGSVAKDGYRGRLAFGVADNVEVAARRDRTRLTRIGGTEEIWITIRRLDLGKQWDYRPFGRHANRVIESKLRSPSREAYWEAIPPMPGFDVGKYAEGFAGSSRLRDHLAFADHPCAIYDVSFFRGGVDRIWLATDLGGLPVRIQRGRLMETGDPRSPEELQTSADYQLKRIDVGAPLELFELPRGATIIPNPDDQ